MSLLSQSSTPRTLGDLLESLGGISPQRVRLQPAPGRATEADVLAVHRDGSVLCELVDGVLVEKALGFRESLLAAALIELLRQFVRPRNLGLVTSPDGFLRLSEGLVRLPDVAFISWQRIPGGRVPDQAIPALVRDLAVEILSRGNTPQEMKRKCHEYFDAGVSLVWVIDPNVRTLETFKSADESTLMDEASVVDGGDVLPGFELRLAELFSELDATDSAAKTPTT